MVHPTIKFKDSYIPVSHSPFVVDRQSFLFLPVDQMDGQEILEQAAVAMSSTVYAVHSRVSFLREHADMLNEQQLDALVNDLDSLVRLVKELEMLFD